MCCSPRGCRVGHDWVTELNQTGYRARTQTNVKNSLCIARTVFLKFLFMICASMFITKMSLYFSFLYCLLVFISLLNLPYFLVAWLVNNLLAIRETWVWSLGWENPLEKGKAPHSSILAWRIPQTVQSMGSKKVGPDWATFTFMPAL